MMIMVWNRKEVHVGYSMAKCSEVRDILAANAIKYTYKVVNRNNSAIFGANRSNARTLGQNIEIIYAYYVYVHKADYDNAYALLNKYE